MVIKDHLGFWLVFCLMPVALGVFGFFLLPILEPLLDNGKHPFINVGPAEIDRRQLVNSLVIGGVFYLVGLFGGWKLARELFTERPAIADPEPVDPSAIKVRK